MANRAKSMLSIASSILDLDVKKFLFGLLDVDTVTALGTNQATAVALVAGKNTVLAADGTVGVMLPKAKKGMQVAIVNTVSNQTLKVYAFTGEVINAITTTSAFSLVGGARGVFECDADAHWYVAAANLTGTSTSSSTAELDTLHSVTPGTAAVSKAVVLDSNGGVSGFPGEVALDGNASGAGAAGFTGGVGTVLKSSVVKVGGIITTRFLIDLTGLGSSTTDLDIIGQGASAAHFGRITAALNGTILSGTMTCLEVPTTGADDIDLWAATEATGKFDDAGGATLTETILVTAGGAWTLGLTKAIALVPPANAYMYLVNGEAGTVGTYDAGKFLIELQGYDA